MRTVGLTLAVVASSAIGGCNPFAFLHCSPYGCAKAEDGRARLQPVIDALTAYSDAEGSYPDHVGDLVPSYLAEFPERPDWATARHGEWWSYEKALTGVSILFVYVGPGVNHCVWSSGEARWRCGGMY